MKKLAMLAIILLTALCLAGCVKLHSDTVIEKDGSGTASLTLSLSPTAAEIAQEMKELGMDEEQDMEMPSFDDIKKDDFAKAAEGHGVTITKFEKSTVEGSDQLDIQMDFKDLKGLSFVMGSAMGGEAGDGYGIFEAADGNFVLKQTHYEFSPEELAVLEGPEEASADEGAESTPPGEITDEEKAQRQMALMGKLMGAMAELDVKLTVTVPGEVIESNAMTLEGNTSIWAVNASNMMNQQQADMAPVIKFSSKGLNIEPLKE